MSPWTYTASGSDAANPRPASTLFAEFTTTRSPSAASRRATAAPIPALDPVTSATLFSDGSSSSAAAVYCDSTVSFAMCPPSFPSRPGGARTAQRRAGVYTADRAQLDRPRMTRLSSAVSTSSTPPPPPSSAPRPGSGRKAGQPGARRLIIGA